MHSLQLRKLSSRDVKKNIAHGSLREITAEIHTRACFLWSSHPASLSPRQLQGTLLESARAGSWAEGGRRRVTSEAKRSRFLNLYRFQGQVDIRRTIQPLSLRWCFVLAF